MGDVAPLILCAFMPCTGTTLPININTLWMGDADLRLYITTVQDG